MALLCFSSSSDKELQYFSVKYVLSHTLEHFRTTILLLFISWYHSFQFLNSFINLYLSKYRHKSLNGFKAQIISDQILSCNLVKI
jgi:hypothetical protein